MIFTIMVYHLYYGIYYGTYPNDIPFGWSLKQSFIIDIPIQMVIVHSGLLVSLSDHPLGSPMVQAWALSGGPGRPMRFARPRVRRQWPGMAPCPLAELGGPPVN